ncbi:unnamed protein product [Camellia sinensis]
MTSLRAEILPRYIYFFIDAALFSIVLSIEYSFGPNPHQLTNSPSSSSTKANSTTSGVTVKRTVTYSTTSEVDGYTPQRPQRLK